MKRERTPLKGVHSLSTLWPLLQISSSHFLFLSHWEKNMRRWDWWEVMAEVVPHQVPGLSQEKSTPLHSQQLDQSLVLSCKRVEEWEGDNGKGGGGREGGGGKEEGRRESTGGHTSLVWISDVSMSLLLSLALKCSKETGRRPAVGSQTLEFNHTNKREVSNQN